MKKLFLVLAFVAAAFAVEESAPIASTAISEPAIDTVSAKKETATPIDVMAANQASSDAEIALRDSLLAAKDSVNAAEKADMQTKLDVTSARCESWEKSYAVLDTNFQTCSKMLRVYAETAEKKTQQLNEASKMNAMAQSTSFVGGVLIGLLIGWLVWD